MPKHKSIDNICRLRLMSNLLSAKDAARGLSQSCCGTGQRRGGGIKRNEIHKFRRDWVDGLGLGGKELYREWDDLKMGE